MKSPRRARTLRNRWNCNFKSRDDNVMRTDNDKMIAAYDIRWELMKPWWELMMPWWEWKKSTFFDVTWRKTWLRTSTGLSTENILQPTRSLYDVWCKSYGSLCVFHVWGDLDLDLRPFKVIIFVVNIDPLVSTKKYWTFSVAEFLLYDCTLKNQCTICVTLTYDLWRSIIFC